MGTIITFSRCQSRAISSLSSIYFDSFSAIVVCMLCVFGTAMSTRYPVFVVLLIIVMSGLLQWMVLIIILRIDKKLRAYFNGCEAGAGR
jgi:hypothetical protein